MKGVRIAELKARLSEYLRQVRRGATVTVLDRETPVAQIVPYSTDTTALSVRPPSRTSPGVNRVPLPPPLEVPVDVVAVLMEERQGER